MARRRRPRWMLPPEPPLDMIQDLTVRWHVVGNVAKYGAALLLVAPVAAMVLIKCPLIIVALFYPVLMWRRFELHEHKPAMARTGLGVTAIAGLVASIPIAADGSPHGVAMALASITGLIALQTERE